MAILELADIVCAEIEDQAQAKNIAIARDVAALQIEADQRLLLSAVTNLMRNAVKFSSEGGRVTLRARALEDRVLFEVEAVFEVTVQVFVIGIGGKAQGQAAGVPACG